MMLVSVVSLASAWGFWDSVVRLRFWAENAML